MDGRHSSRIRPSYPAGATAFPSFRGPATQFDGPGDLRARHRESTLAMAGSGRVRARLAAARGHAGPRRNGQRSRAAPGAGPRRQPGRDVHLVGGPKTIETFRALGALDKLGLLVLPVLFGEGRRLTDSPSPDAELTLESAGAV